MKYYPEKKLHNVDALDNKLIFNTFDAERYLSS